MYIPLGGNKNKFRNFCLVFGFVAMWHDLNLSLFYWAGFICLVFTFEF
jgi:hypothetical protein